MKTKKRAQSLVLLAICLCVWCVAAMLPCTAVSAADFNGYTQNFDAVTTLDGLDGWSTDSAFPSVVTEENNNALEVTSTTMAKFTADSDGLTGRYEVKFSIKPGSTGEFFVDFGTGGNNKNTLWHGKEGKLYLTSGATIANSVYAGAYEAGQWYHVSAMIDTEVQYYSVEVKNATGDRVAYRNGLPFVDKDGKLNELRFRNLGGTDDKYLIDNVSVKTTTEKMDKVFFEDNFESYQSFDLAADGVNSASYHGWITTNGAADNAKPKLETEKDGNKYMRISNAPLAMDWGSRDDISGGGVAEYKTGKLRFSASMRFSNGCQILVKLSQQRNNFQNGVLALRAAGNWFNSYGMPWGTDGVPVGNQIAVGQYINDQWYDVAITLDLDNKTYDVATYQNGSLIAEQKGLGADLLEWVGKLTSLDNISICRWNEIGDIDNVKLEYVNENEPEEPEPPKNPEDYIICDDNFSDINAGNAESEKWTIGQNVNDGYLVTFNPEEMPGTVKLGGNYTTVTKTFPSVYSTGKYRFTWNARFNGTQTRSLVEALVSGQNFGAILMSIDANGNMYYGCSPWSSNESRLGKEPLELGKWYTFETIYDLNKKTMEYTVKDSEGHTPVDHVLVDNLVYASGADVKPLSTFNFNRFKITNMCNGNALNMYLKDLKVEDYEPVPEITAKSITLIDGANNRISDITEPVSRVIRQIILNFKCELDESTLEGITLTNTATNSEVEYTAEVADGTYVMTLTAPVLDPNTKYQIYIPDTVSNLRGQKIDSSKELEFKTNNASLAVRLNGLKRGTDDITAVSQLRAGEKITVDTTAVNVGDDDISLTWIAAYYKDNGTRMVYTTDSAPVTVNNTNSGVISFELTVPKQSILSEVDSMSVYLWDGINSLVPCCKALDIPKNTTEQQ